jgi:hypothetical protein
MGKSAFLAVSLFIKIEALWSGIGDLPIIIIDNHLECRLIFAFILSSFEHQIDIHKIVGLIFLL